MPIGTSLTNLRFYNFIAVHKVQPSGKIKQRVKKKKQFIQYIP